MNNPLYSFMIKNCKRYIKKNNTEQYDQYFNAFEIAQVLAIALCKIREDVLLDLISDKYDSQ